MKNEEICILTLVDSWCLCPDWIYNKWIICYIFNLYKP